MRGEQTLLLFCAFVQIAKSRTVDHVESNAGSVVALLLDYGKLLAGDRKAKTYFLMK